MGPSCLNLNENTQPCIGSILIHFKPKCLKLSYQWACGYAHHFWDYKGLLLVHFQKPGEAVGATSYCTFLGTFVDSVGIKEFTLSIGELLFLYDSARPLAAPGNVGRSLGTEWSLSDYPLHTLDLTPSDFHLFSVLEENIAGKFVSGSAKVEREVWHCLRQPPMQFYAASFQKKVKRSDKHINVFGN
jgi:hypothetical protein